VSETAALNASSFPARAALALELESPTGSALSARPDSRGMCEPRPCGTARRYDRKLAGVPVSGGKRTSPTRPHWGGFDLPVAREVCVR